ncbi:nuclear transport factor 2 family protein [Parvularcula sp. ZS-1/3]|uniref:Nuclear transport factor 2 family protein n=1 Tax=Parvularcula mediterranea TaxID=2732508 RepID=A0A7Y3RJ73_9PROT|nr:nuclear transport factor 2 family protein [Parvularcula mediterranea]NNU15016.1 nuclear transport factor 2 family protein [Parvularcula mediterranea]
MSILAALALTIAPVPDLETTTARIAERDALLFETFFERCDPQTALRLLDDDFRMLHDLGGMVADSAEAFVADYEKTCSERDPATYRSKREIVPGSRSVQMLGDWGALEEGEHTFHESNGGAPFKPTGKARYIHTWRWTGTDFILVESLSVDHGPYQDE